MKKLNQQFKFAGIITLFYIIIGTTTYFSVKHGYENLMFFMFLIAYFINMMIFISQLNKELTNFVDYCIQECEEQIALCEQGKVTYSGDIDQITAYDNKIKHHEFMIARLKRFL